MYRKLSPITVLRCRFIIKCTMSSGKGRKRGAVEGSSASEGNSGNKSGSSRRKVKIEIEEEKELTTSEYFTEKKELTTSKYFKTEEDGKSAKGVGKGSPGKKLKEEPVKIEPPDNWEELLKNIQVMRSTKTAVVDTMGCERTADLSQEPKVQRFQTLVSLMLSSQTKDQVTYAAMERLKGKGLNVQSMLVVDEAELAETLKPVGFYKRKATYIKKTSVILREKYGDDIPNTIEGLCALPGVGPKMAYICMNVAWKEVVGIGVDTHVHRIANRLKWTGKKGTSTPEKTREALESWMPKDLWQEINLLLVGFGQETCLPIGPKCESCLNKAICPASTAKKSKGGK